MPEHNDLTEETIEPTAPTEAGETPHHEAVDPENLNAEALHSELTALKDEFETMRNQLMRTLADFQNFRKRKDTEIQSLRTFAAERLVQDLLPVLDNFHRTLDALQQGSSLDSIKSGLLAIERQFMSVLEGHHVRQIEAHGQPFDPEMHEAIGHDSTDEHPEDTVIHVLEPGYKMADRIIRPARVRVSKKP